MGTRENKVETYLNAEITKLGGLTRKWVSPGRDGVPDRIVILCGRVMFVEVKTSDGELTTVQRREHDLLKGAGAEVFTVYGEKDFNEFIERLMK